MRREEVRRQKSGDRRTGLRTLVCPEVKKRLKSVILQILFLFTVHCSLFTVHCSAQDDLLYLEHADTLKNVTKFGINEKFLIGNVLFTQGESSIASDFARYNENIKISTFWDNVEIIDTTKVLTCDSLVYSQISDSYALRGNVVYKDTSYELRADKADYFRKDLFIRAYENAELYYGNTVVFANEITHSEKLFQARAEGNVTVTNDSHKVVLSSNLLIYNTDIKVLVALGEPVLTKFDSTGKQQLKVIGKRMEGYQDSSYFLVTEDVRITSEEFDAFCDSAFYYTETSKLVLRSEPRIKQKSNDLDGRLIEILFKDEKLDSVFVKGKAFAKSLSEKTGNTNLMKGKEITMVFKDGELNESQIKQNAESVYYLDDKSGANQVSGSFIKINFDKQKVVEIEVQTGSEGTYFPRKYQSQIQLKE
ncbi:MAG: hypothetical protein DWQ06_09440 [Calditrichaeota bacterium]|nr:MAG: hypothetical protein DWQ06_09440 [Calditrichota bacterium]